MTPGYFLTVADLEIKLYHRYVCLGHTSVQFSSVTSDSLWPHGLQHAKLPCPSPSPWACSNSCPLSRWCRPTIAPSVIPSPPAFNLSQHQGFSNESVLIRWQKYCSFSISPSNEYSGPTAFRMDWLDLLAVQGTLKSLLQHHSSKASILWHSAFFVVQLSHPYTTSGKTIALTRWTFVGKVMSLLLNCGAGEDALRVPWTVRISSQSILKEISPEYLL